MRKKIQKLKKDFQDSMSKVADILGISPSEITRDDYVRITVDCGIDSKLNKENLNIIGGFKKVKDEFFPPILDKLPSIKILYYILLQLFLF